MVFFGEFLNFGDASFEHIGLILEEEVNDCFVISFVVDCLDAFAAFLQLWDASD